jgi:hypothetical protein
LRTNKESEAIDSKFREHIADLIVNPVKKLSSFRHPAKYQSGLPTALVELAKSPSIGDPMAGSGRLVEETEKPFYLNDIDPKCYLKLKQLSEIYGSTVTCDDVRNLMWQCDVMIFSPPYYPRTDRKKPNHHNDEKRGAVVGFRDTYGIELDGFIGEPGGVDAILSYRNAMREIYAKLLKHSEKMIVVTKNWTRLGVELRLDWDTILTASEVGWKITDRHGWIPNQSLWSRFNQSRNTGVTVEDVLVFEK